MTTTTVQTYAVYLTAATSAHPAGYVVDNVEWDGASAWTPPAGTTLIADPDRKYPIGSTYGAPVTATTATTTAATVTPTTATATTAASTTAATSTTT
ncbi:hypothetical protein F1645_06105 [Novacetimonas hansenii]|uniref:Uncharacterized protein n=3 Tax=Novacetimonas hansenii TaxID=436 RepID=A0ABQ0SIJ6_NOVHA|nr:hypothetical protein [Novacetimonas hansenii]EFG83721.1 hypothetical protein GXY_11818 [Novacetimonas hansenii ATCC 23769]GBQ58724.1 hypothetical protein AA0243_1868 [Novacetimonas hansenii NRIC 0243]GEC65215.1 hypothetical protein GHA01_30640 [Novacetimonas hansenii]